MRHFAANIWQRQKSKKVIKQLKLVCASKAEKTFETRLAKLRGYDERTGNNVVGGPNGK